MQIYACPVVGFGYLDFGACRCKGEARILARLDSAQLGNFGDCKPVGEGVAEMRVHVGAGYRIYYTRAGMAVYVLLTGGDKSTQKKDIARAKKMARALKGTKK